MKPSKWHQYARPWYKGQMTAAGFDKGMVLPKSSGLDRPGLSNMVESEG
jgi:hypothetical protein